MSPAVDRLITERERQGLPRTIDDTDAVTRLVNLIAAALRVGAAPASKTRRGAA